MKSIIRDPCRDMDPLKVVFEIKTFCNVENYLRIFKVTGFLIMYITSFTLNDFFVVVTVITSFQSIYSPGCIRLHGKISNIAYDS